MPNIELYIILLIVCLVFSAFFSGSETAYISLQRFRLEYLVSTKVKGARNVSRMIEKPERFLSTVLFGNTLVNAAAAALATSLWRSTGGAIAVLSSPPSF
jgi:putative hemolysin